LKLAFCAYRRRLAHPFRYGDRFIDFREGLLLRVQLHQETRYFEAAPLAGHSWETLEQCIEALPSLVVSLSDEGSKGPWSALPALSFLRESYFSAEKNKVTRSWSGPVLFNGLLPNLEQWGLSGWRSWPHASTVKVKIRPGQGSLLAALMGVRPDLLWRLDSNRAFEEKSFHELLACLSPDQLAKIEYWEDPFPSDCLGEKGWGRSSTVPLAVDEGANSFSFGDCSPPPAFAKSARYWICKPMVFGGIQRAAAAARWLWEGFGIKTVFSSALESEVARLALIEFLGTPEGREPQFARTHGLAIGGLFEVDGWPGGWEFHGPPVLPQSTLQRLQRHSWSDLN
jgi:O-succinylbenzoate synthase